MTGRDRAGALALALLALPPLVGGAYSLAATVGLAGAGARGFDAGRLVRVLGAWDTWRSVAWTVSTAGIATVIATVAAVAVALRLRGSRVARWFAIGPLAVPHIAAALAALLLLGQSGLLSRIAFAFGLVSVPSDFPVLVYDRPGIALILAFAWKEFPFIALTAFAVLDTRTDALAEVARTLGASEREVMRRVTWPLLRRGLMPAVVAAFAFLLGQYEMAALLAPSDPMALPVLTYERAFDPVLAHRGDAYALGVLALLIAGIVVVIHERYRRAADAAFA